MKIIHNTSKKEILRLEKRNLDEGISSVISNHLNYIKECLSTVKKSFSEHTSLSEIQPERIQTNKGLDKTGNPHTEYVKSYFETTLAGKKYRIHIHMTADTNDFSANAYYASFSPNVNYISCFVCTSYSNPITKSGLSAICNIDEVIDCIENDREPDMNSDLFWKQKSDLFKIEEFEDYFNSETPLFDKLCKLIRSLKHYGSDYCLGMPPAIYEEMLTRMTANPSYVYFILAAAARTGKSHCVLEILEFYRHYIGKLNLLVIVLPHNPAQLLDDWKYKLTHIIKHAPYIFEASTIISDLNKNKLNSFKLLEKAIKNSSNNTPLPVLICNSSQFTDVSIYTIFDKLLSKKLMNDENTCFILDECHESVSTLFHCANMGSIQTYKNYDIDKLHKLNSCKPFRPNLVIGLSATYHKRMAIDKVLNATLLCNYSRGDALRDNLVCDYVFDQKHNVTYGSTNSNFIDYHDAITFLFDEMKLIRKQQKAILMNNGITWKPITLAFENTIKQSKETYDLLINMGYKPSQILRIDSNKNKFNASSLGYETLDDYLMNDVNGKNVEIILSIATLVRGATITRCKSIVLGRVFDDKLKTQDINYIEYISANLQQALERASNVVKDPNGNVVELDCVYSGAFRKKLDLFKFGKMMEGCSVTNHRNTFIEEYKVDKLMNHSVNGILVRDNPAYMFLLCNTLYALICKKHTRTSKVKSFNCYSIDGSGLPKLEFKRIQYIKRLCNVYSNITTYNDDDSLFEQFELTSDDKQKGKTLVDYCFNCTDKLFEELIIRGYTEPTLAIDI